MILRKVGYRQWHDTPKEWTLSGLTLRDINLLVGTNASGKSKALNVIKNAAIVISGKRKPDFMSADFDLEFDQDGTTLKYKLTVAAKKVTKEEFWKGNECLLNRDKGGKGKIWASALDTFIDFHVTDTDVAILARNDSIQHPFFEGVIEWAKALQHYPFGTPMGKDHFVMAIEKPADTEDVSDEVPTDANNVVKIFQQGLKDFPDVFRASVLSDLASVGYDCEEVALHSPTSIVIKGPVPAKVLGLGVKERSLTGWTDQSDMSQGMFRALSVIVLLNHAILAGSPSCVLIDDIGEGLDFERSCALIKLIMDKARRSLTQLVMSTNDRFVMNVVPLESWSVLKRVGGKCVVHDYLNSKAIFDEFKFTGMNNFDFLAVDYLSSSSSSSSSIDEDE